MVQTMRLASIFRRAISIGASLVNKVRKVMQRALSAGNALELLLGNMAFLMWNF